MAHFSGILNVLYIKEKKNYSEFIISVKQFKIGYKHIIN